MTLTPIQVDIDTFPTTLRPLLSGARLYDSSSSREARVIFVDRAGGYFIKIAAAGTLAREADMTRFFHGKGLAAPVLEYATHGGRDWLLTQKLPGEDCVAAHHLEQPQRLCDLLAERLFALHEVDASACPVHHHTQAYLARAARHYESERYDQSHFPDSFGYTTAKEAWAVVRDYGHLLQADTLLHGDYCLPNIILRNWRLSGFIDLGCGGVGDRHVDLFWGAWSLGFNLKTDAYRQRFFDAYGRAHMDADMLSIVAAVEVFG